MTTPSMKEILRVTASDREDAMTTPTPSDKIVDDLVWCGRQLYHYEQPIMVPLSPEGFAAFDRARRMIHDYRRDLAAALEWKEVLLNELIIDHIYTKEHETNPRKAIHDAITWNCQVALDPAVSSDAQKLRDTHLQRAEAAERDAFTMAAGQCIVKSGGLMADDHGHQYCDMERQRDEWKRKAEEAARDAARWKVCLDAEGVAVSIFNCDPASWRYPEGDQLVAAIDAIRTGADNAWSVPIHKCEPVHDESPPHDAAIAAKGEA